MGGAALRHELQDQPGRRDRGGLSEIDRRRATPHPGISDVCGWWTRDGLTVEPGAWKPGHGVEDQDARNSILAGVKAPRPDTLTQTGEITSQMPLADGAGLTSLV